MNFPMNLPHFIALDLQPDIYFGNPCWFNGQLKSGFERLEKYLAKWARFQELHPEHSGGELYGA